MPSFIVTLAFLLAWQGVIQKLIGETGVIVIQDETIFNVANYFLSELAAGSSRRSAIGALRAQHVVGRASAGAGTASSPTTSPLVAIKLACVIGVDHVRRLVGCNDQARGFPFVGAARDRAARLPDLGRDADAFGRHVYAVGGNAEAARRAGINVKRDPLVGVRASRARMAGVGGVIFASRLSSVDLNAGGGTILLDAIAAAVIGGTSLFGGRGEVIERAARRADHRDRSRTGSSLLGYSSATQYIVTGVILLAAVTLDTVSRRRLAASGR